MFYSSVTLAGLLNAMDGIEAAEGRLLFATTNHKDSLDPALYRPGRMDVHVEFGKANKYQAKELFKRFYPKNEFGLTSRSAKLSSASTPSTSSLSQSKSSSRQSSVDSHASGHGYPDDLVSAASSAAPEIAAFLETSVQLSGRLPAAAHATASRLSQPPGSHGHDIEFLATQFSSLVPERSCTMAMLQEYLMNFKRDPVGASLEANVSAYLNRVQPLKVSEDAGISDVGGTKANDSDRGEGSSKGMIHKGELDDDVADILE